MSATGPSGSAIIALSQDNNLVAEPMFVMRTVTGPRGIGPVLEHMPAHLAYWAEMEARRVVFAAGPVMPADLAEPWSGEGLVIFRAESLDAARKIAEDDPMHAASARDFDLEPWLLNHLVT